MMPKLQVLVGMIASGKSTYCKNAARAGALCVNDDAIVNMLHGDDYTLYDKALKVLYKTVENQVIGTALALGRTVIVDRGLNVSVTGRKRWLALARSFDVPCEALLFKNEGPSVHARRRADNDLRGHDYAYWLKVANTHNALFIAPSLEEGFEAIHPVSWQEIGEGKVIF